MKVIFLDFDGVINGQSHKGMGLKLPIIDEDNKTVYNYFHIGKVHILLDFLNMCVKMNYKIVISSTWRLHIPYQNFNDFFRNIFNILELRKQDLVIGSTTEVYKDRGLQVLEFIEDWNKVNDDKIERYVVIDDDTFDIIGHIWNKNNGRFIHIGSTQGWWEEDLYYIQSYLENMPKRVSQFLKDNGFILNKGRNMWYRIFDCNNHRILITHHNKFNYFNISGNIKYEFKVYASWHRELKKEYRGKTSKPFELLMPTITNIHLPKDFTSENYQDFLYNVEQFEKEYEFETQEGVDVRKSRRIQ